MRRRTAAACLVAGSALLLLSQLRLLPQDQGVLLEVSGRPVDVAGQLQGAWLRLVRRCGTVTALADGSPAWQEAQHVLAGYSPPASQAARPLQVLSWGQGDAQWLLAEVRWGGSGSDIAPLDPAIVPLARAGGNLQVQASGVWSGNTGPWSAPVFIRRFLAERLPALPAALRQCLDPQLLPFSR